MWVFVAEKAFVKTLHFKMELAEQPPEVLSLLFEYLSLKDFLRLSMVIA